MIKKPFLALCENRDALPKSHPTSGKPEEWFSNEILSTVGLFGFSVDFFINWTSNPIRLSNEFWIKGYLDAGVSLEMINESAPKSFFEFIAKEELEKIFSLLSNRNINVFLILFNDDSDWNNDNSTLGKVSVKKEEEELVFEIEVITLSELKKQIKNLSGGAVKIGAKGLIYGTSKLECTLSKTDSLYPGDADLIVYEENEPKAILEFKKHTLDSKIEDQKLSNYYPYPDGRKYDRLALLRNHLSEGQKNIPIIIIYYPTKPIFAIGKMEIIIGEPQKMITLESSIFDLPKTNTIDDFVPIAQKLRNAIDYFYANY